MMGRSAETSAAVLSAGVLLSLLLAGCARTAGKNGQPGLPWYTRPAHVSEPMLGCSQATRAAREAVVRMGYSVDTVVAAKPGAPGKVIGKVDSAWTNANPGSSDIHRVTVTIRCSDRGSDFEAVTDEGFTTQMTFGQRFAKALRENVDRKVIRPHLSDEPAPGLDLRMHPLRSDASQSALGIDLPSSGVTPVKITIANRTPRRYRFRSSKVRLVTEEGTRETPLSAAAAAQRVVRSGDAGPTAARLRKEMIADGEIAPGDSLSGYLYFDAAAYRRARVILTDVASDEPEGFSVEF